MALPGRGEKSHGGSPDFKYHNMKIAITGHKQGIGKAFAEQLSARGHTIVGISRSDGENIRRVEHTASLIEPCELFINNAQSQYAQTELLYAVWKRWQDKDKQKYIWNISTIMIESPINGTPDGEDDITMSQYRNQKLALEEASRQLNFKNSNPEISTIRPGGVFTGRGDPSTKANVIDTFTQHENIYISEISIGHTKQSIPL
jgi:nucleoside-diphosphate-sugar epimerase